jgi:5'-nucleotidase
MEPLILVTNDDGVLSPGLAAAAAAVRHLGELLIVAPRWQQTTMGRAFPRAAGVGAIEACPLRIGGIEVPAYGVVGSPAQAVAHGILELAGRRPALCVSGINYGENLGLSLTCSGTLGAAFEAWSLGVPAIAASREAPAHLQHASDYPELDWDCTCRALALLAGQVLDRGLPPGTSVLNLNVPDGAGPATPLRVTRQSRRSPSRWLPPPPRDRGAGYQLEYGPDPEQEAPEPGSDIHAFHQERVLSVTPVSWDLSANATWTIQ